MTNAVPVEMLSGPFSLERARRLGVGDHVLRSGRFVRLYPRVYVPVGHELSVRESCLAALMTAPAGSAICGVAAVKLRGLDLPARMDAVSDIDVLVPATARWQAPPGLRARRTRRAWTRSSKLLASPGITFALLGLDEWTVDELVQVGDRMTQRRNPWTTVETLRQAATGASGQPGRARLVAAADLVRARTDSLRETQLRLVVVGAGLPCPEVNVGVVGRSRRIDVWVDMGYPQLKVGLEYDGAVHWESDASRHKDHFRQRSLEERGWILIRATAYDLEHPATFLAALRRALNARGLDAR